MTRAYQLLEDQIDHLHTHSRLRVWSLVITIFGDAVQLRGGRVAMADLQVLMDRTRVELGTLRTAMSRLTKDGWVDRDRLARNSFYTLSPSGVQHFTTATHRIYAAQANAGDALAVGILEPRTGKSKTHQDKFLSRSMAMVPRPGCAIWVTDSAPTEQDMADAGVFSLPASAGSVPDWVIDQLGTPERAAQFEQLAKRWSATHANISALHDLSPLDAMVMRTLLIHDWRRTLLRQPDIPAKFLPDDWPEPACRAQIGAIYNALLPHSESWWSTPVTPAGMDALERRFPMQAPVTQRNFVSG